MNRLPVIGIIRAGLLLANLPLTQRLPGCNLQVFLAKPAGFDLGDEGTSAGFHCLNI